MDKILPDFLDDGITWPEAIVTLGILGFIGFCVLAFVVLMISLLSE